MDDIIIGSTYRVKYYLLKRNRSLKERTAPKVHINSLFVIFYCIGFTEITLPLLSDKQCVIFHHTACTNGAFSTIWKESYKRGTPSVVHVDCCGCWFSVLSCHTEPCWTTG